VAHIWVGENGKLVRGTIEDAHTGTRLALDLSEVVAFLQASLMHSPEQVGSPQTEGSQEQPGDEPGKGPSDADDRHGRLQNPHNGDKG